MSMTKGHEKTTRCTASPHELTALPRSTEYKDVQLKAHQNQMRAVKPTQERARRCMSSVGRTKQAGKARETEREEVGAIVGGRGPFPVVRQIARAKGRR